jgi:hypothetical protein
MKCHWIALTLPDENWLLAATISRGLKEENNCLFPDDNYWPQLIVDGVYAVVQYTATAIGGKRSHAADKHVLQQLGICDLENVQRQSCPMNFFFVSRAGKALF